MDNNSLRKPIPPKSITHIENEHFALWLSSHKPELRFPAIQHSIFDVLQDMGITKNAVLKAALTQISLCCKVDLKRASIPTTREVNKPKIHSSEKLLHLKKNLYSDKKYITKTFDKYRQIIKNKFERCKFQSKSSNSVNGSQTSPGIDESNDEEKIKLLFVERNIDNDCVSTKDSLSVNKPENTTTVVLKRKAKSKLNKIEMGTPVKKLKRKSESHDNLKHPLNNNVLHSSKNCSPSYKVSKENTNVLSTYETCNTRDDEVIKNTKNYEFPFKEVEVKSFVSTESTNNYPSKQTTKLKEMEKFVSTEFINNCPSKQATELREDEKFESIVSTNNYLSKQTTELKEVEKFVSTKSANNCPSKQATKVREDEKFVSTESTNNYPSKQATELSEDEKFVSIVCTNNYLSKQTTELKEVEKFVSTKSTNNCPSKQNTELKEIEKCVSTKSTNNYSYKQTTKLKEMEKFVTTEAANNYPFKQTIELKEDEIHVSVKSTNNYPYKQTSNLKEMEIFVSTESTNLSKQSTELKEVEKFVSTESTNLSKQFTKLKEVEKVVCTESTNPSKQPTELKVYKNKSKLPNIDGETSNKCHSKHNSNNIRSIKKSIRSINSKHVKCEKRLYKDKTENKNITENVNRNILELSSKIFQSNVKNVQESIVHTKKSTVNESPDVKNVEENNIGKIRVRDINTLLANSELIKETPVLPLDISNNKTNKSLLEFKKIFVLPKPKIPKYVLESFSRNDIRFMKLYTSKFNELVDSKIEIMGGLLHMGITDYLCKQERLKWADKLLSEKSICTEKQRIEKEFRDIMRQRGIEFSALLGSIVNKFEDNCVKDMFFALYARLVETLLKIDAENEKHVFLSKDIIYNMLLRNNYTNKIVMGLFQINNEVFKQSFSKFNSLIKFCNSFYATEDGNIHKFNPNELECQQLSEGIFLNESKTLPVINNCFIIQSGQENVKNNLYMMKGVTCSIPTNTPQQNDLFNNSSNEDSEIKDTSVSTVNQLEDSSDKVTDFSENKLKAKITEEVSVKDSTKLDHAYAEKIQCNNIISDNSEKENHMQNSKVPEEIETIDITDNEEVSTDQSLQSIEISQEKHNSNQDSISSPKVRNVGVVYPMANNMLQSNASNVVISNNVVSSSGNAKVGTFEQTNKINFTKLKKVIIKKDGMDQVVSVFPKVLKLSPNGCKLSPQLYKVHVPNRHGLGTSKLPHRVLIRKASSYVDKTSEQLDTVFPTITRSQFMGLQRNGNVILTDTAIQNDAQTVPSSPFIHLNENDRSRKLFYFANNASSSNVNNTEVSSIQAPEGVIVYNNTNSQEQVPMMCNVQVMNSVAEQSTQRVLVTQGHFAPHQNGLISYHHPN